MQIRIICLDIIDNLGDDEHDEMMALIAKLAAFALPAAEPKFEWEARVGSCVTEEWCMLGKWEFSATIEGAWQVCFNHNLVYFSLAGKTLEGAKSAAEAWARENIIIHKF